MYCNKKEEKQHTLWTMAALLAPLTQAASNCSWPAAACTGVICVLLCWSLEHFGVEGTSSKWIGAVQWLWMLLVVSEFLHWTMLCWPNHRSYHTVPLVLLSMAALASARGKETSSVSAAVLFWFTAVLLGVVLLSGIREVEIMNLKLEWKMQTAHLITVLLIPAMGMGLGYEKREGKRLLYAVAVAAVTGGVLSMQMVEEMEAPFYEMSRTLKFLGMGQRFESLAAAGMMLGYYILFTYLLSVMANVWDVGKENGKSVWISAVFAAMVFISGMRMNSKLLALGTILIWVLIPALEKSVKIMKKPIDK